MSGRNAVRAGIPALMCVGALSSVGCDFTRPSEVFVPDGDVIAIGAVFSAGWQTAYLIATHPHRPGTADAPVVAAVLAGPGGSAAFTREVITRLAGTARLGNTRRMQMAWLSVAGVAAFVVAASSGLPAVVQHLTDKAPHPVHGRGWSVGDERVSEGIRSDRQSHGAEHGRRALAGAHPDQPVEFPVRREQLVSAVPQVEDREAMVSRISSRLATQYFHASKMICSKLLCAIPAVYVSCRTPRRRK